MTDEKSAAPPGRSEQYISAAERTRTAAQWLIGAFAAVGAAMLAGLQLTGLGELEGSDLAFAVVAVVAGIVGVALAIFACARVLTPAQATVADLSDSGLVSSLTGDPLLSGLVNSPAELASSLTDARNDYNAAWAATDAGKPGSAANKNALAAQDRLFAISGVVNAVLHYAVWRKVNDAFSLAKVLTGIGSVMALAGMLGYAYLTSRPESFSPGAADARPATPVTITFDGDRQKAMSSVLGSECDLGAVSALLLSTDSETSELDLVSLKTAACKPAHFTLEPGQGLSVRADAPKVPSSVSGK
jgi:hypothetical protein